MSYPRCTYEKYRNLIFILMRTKKSKTIRLLALLFYSYSMVCIGNLPGSLIIAIAKKKKKEISEAMSSRSTMKALTLSK